MAPASPSSKIRKPNVTMMALSGDLFWTGRGNRAEHEAGGERDDESQPIVGSVAEHPVSDVGGDHRHRSLGEVDDVGGPEDEHESECNRCHDHARGDSAQGEVEEELHDRGSS
jgi:hypothetical protein